jgi:DNA-binding protein YbaB
VDNDAARHELAEALALVQEHMADLAIVEKKRAALSATASTAAGRVVVTVDSRGVVSKAAVDESYLDHYDLAELGTYFTVAAQSAASDVERQTAELLAPLAERRARFPSLSDIVEGAPDIRDLVPPLNPVDQKQHWARDHEHHGDEPGHYPTVRSEQ